MPTQVTPISISNSALTKLGGKPIQSFEEGSNEANAMQAVYDLARRDLLRAHPWNCAVKRVLLAPSTTGPAYKYRYRFPLPADCLRVLEVNGNKDFKIEGRAIVTSAVGDASNPTAKLKYIFDNTDVATWDATLVTVFVHRLALDVAYTITGKSSAVSEQAGLYEHFLDAARAIDAQEDVEDPIDETWPDLIAVRFGE